MAFFVKAGKEMKILDSDFFQNFHSITLAAMLKLFELGS
jgi:hypothetical protein